MDINDWRLTNQADYLYKKELLHIPYEPYRNNWEHDHCEFCQVEISLSANTEQSGYCTKDNYHWICESCFEDFKDMFEWKVAEKQ